MAVISSNLCKKSKNRADKCQLERTILSAISMKTAQAERKGERAQRAWANLWVFNPL